MAPISAPASSADEPQTLEPQARGWLSRLGWLVLLWVGGVAALAIVAFLFRLLMSAAGLTAGGGS